MSMTPQEIVSELDRHIVGQPAAKANLKVFVYAARARGEDRVLVGNQWIEVPTYLNAKRLLAS